MTGLEQVVAGNTLDVLMKGDERSFVDWTDDMEVEELVDVGVALTAMSKVSSLRAGYVAYRIRTKTPDGEWGEMKWRLAEEWGVSDRTVQRWMAAAQDHFGFELTPAQANARAPRRADGASDDEPSQGGIELEWDGEDEDELLGPAGFDSSLGDPLENQQRFRELIGDAGWGDHTLPSADYVNPPPAEETAPVGRPMLLPPDDTWVAFTASQLKQEFPAYADETAERLARARWDRKTQNEPLDLLEELREIHGENLPDEVVETLQQAEANKPIKPDEVSPPREKSKGSRGSGGKIGTSGPQDGPKNVERGMIFAREVHAHIHQLRRDGGDAAVDEWYGAARAELAGWSHAVESCLKVVKECAGAAKRLASEAPDF